MFQNTKPVKDHKYFMNVAFAEAERALSINEVPIGAIIVKDNEIIGRGHNTVIQNNSVLSHAELNAILDASKNINNYRLVDCDMYVTVEPCYMCCMALVHARIANLYFDTKQLKTGAVESTDVFFDKQSHNHRVKHSFLGEITDSKQLITNFFRDRR